MGDQDQSRLKKRKISKDKESQPSRNENTAQGSRQKGPSFKHRSGDKREGTKIEPSSWLSVVRHKDASNDYLDTVPGAVEEVFMRTRHIELFPTTSQQQPSRAWLENQRCLYSRASKIRNEGPTMSIKGLSPNLTNKDTYTPEPYDRLLNKHHCTTRDGTFHKLVINSRSDMAEYRMVGIPLRLEFESRKAQSLSLPYKDVVFSRGNFVLDSRLKGQLYSNARSMPMFHHRIKLPPLQIQSRNSRNDKGRALKNSSPRLSPSV